MHLLWRLVRMARKHMGVLLIAVVGLVGASLLSLVTPGVIRSMTALLENPGENAARVLGMQVALLLGAYALRSVCRFFSMSFSHLAAWRFVADLTLEIYDKLQHLSLRYYQDKQTGQIMSRMVNDTRQIELLVAHAVPDLVSNLLLILGVAVMLFRINPGLAGITLIPVPLVVIVGSLFSKKIAPMFRINQEVLGDLNGVLQDNLSGMKEIQAFAQEKKEHARMSKYRDLYAHVNIRANFANAVFHPGVEFLTSVGTALIVGLGGMRVLGGTMALPDIVGFLMYISLFYQPLAILARLVEDVLNASAGAVRIFEVLDAKSDVQEKPGALELPRIKGQIGFDHVSFHYNEKEPVLVDVSFEAKPGEMVALVGPTGVGKSTMAALLERFYDPQKGVIRLDGHDIRDVTLQSLRSQLSMVLQDVFLFNGTLADNIAYGVQEATRAQVEAAARIAHADEFIRAMPQGYDTVVGERGVRLSGGQKQRIAIARAVLRDTPVLILDEATSAIDTETEAEIQAAIEQLAGTRTLLVIAHRLSTVMRADCILVLEEGRIVARGTHEELLAQGGAYARMWARGKA